MLPAASAHLHSYKSCVLHGWPLAMERVFRQSYNLVTMEELKVSTPARMALVDITEEVNRAVARMGATNGLCNLFVPHTTCSVIVSENWDPAVTTDMLGHLQRIVPRDGGFRHSEGNAQAHILSVMLGTSINIPVRGGRLALGQWQGVMLAEFDGPRERSVTVSVMAAEITAG